MSSCQTFRNKIGDIDTSLFNPLFEAYMADPSQANEKALEDKLKVVREFVGEYQQRTRGLLKKWYPSYSDEAQKQAFADSIAFDQDQRVVINMDLSLGDFRPVSHFPSLIKGIEGNLDIERGGIAHIDHLEFVKGSFTANHSSLYSAAALKSVGADLDLTSTRLTALDSLESVGGTLEARDSNLSSLSRLKTVGGHLFLDKAPITNIDFLEAVGQTLRGSKTLKSLAKLRTVGGNLVLSHSQITNLSSLETVEQELSVSFCHKLRTIPKLRTVGWTLHISDTPINELDSVERIGGGLLANNSHLASMANLVEIGELLDIRQNKNIFLPDFLSRFPKLKRIGTKNEVSVRVSSKFLQQIILRLRDEGLLSFEGKVTSQ